MRDPRHEVIKNNPWYVDDQLSAQLGNPATRHVVETRWGVFASLLAKWHVTRSPGGSLRILDAGCGDGINLIGLSRILATREIKAELYGCDYNDLRIRRARGLDDIRSVYVASLLAMPFPSGCFDLVLCNHVLEHIPEDGRAVAELNRILKPGGLLIAGVPNEGCIMAQARNHIVQPEISRTTDHIHFHTRGTFVSLLESAKFQIIQVNREGFFMPYLSWNARLNASSWGRRILRGLSRLCPSQGADLIVGACKR